MKKVLLFAMLTIAALTQTASAQGWWAGGRLGYAHAKVDGISANTFSIAPEVGYDFNAKWSAGLGLSMDIVSTEGVSANVFSVSPYARYKYFKTGILTLFVDGGFGLAFGDADGFKVGFTPGVSIDITKHLSVLTSIGFLGYQKDYYNGGDGEAYGIDLSSSNLKFGFYYSF